MSKNNVTLLCGYELYFDVAPPHIGSEVWCPRHRRIEMVIQSPGKETTYRGKCTTCQYGMKNIDLRRVLRQAKKHVNAHGHSVRIYDAIDRRKTLGTLSPKNVTGHEQLEISTDVL